MKGLAQPGSDGLAVRKISCETCAARGRGAVCDLPAEALAELRAAGTFAIYRPHQLLFSEGSPVDGLHLLCDGKVKLYHSDRFGRDHILEVAGPGAVLGEVSLDEKLAHSVSAEALTESQVHFLPNHRLGSFLKRHPTAGVHLIAALSRELVLARRKARDLVLRGAESRLAALLLELSGAESGTPDAVAPLRLAYTRQQLAEMIGVSTETAIRMLAKLKRKGVVTVAGRQVTVADPAKLKQVAHRSDAGAAGPIVKSAGRVQEMRPNRHAQAGSRELRGARPRANPPPSS